MIDHFLQDRDWADEFLAAVDVSGASLFSVGVECPLAELERRESARADGDVEGRPKGLARRSDELCRSVGLDHDITVSTSEHPIDESVTAVLEAMRAAGHPS